MSTSIGSVEYGCVLKDFCRRLANICVSHWLHSRRMSDVRRRSSNASRSLLLLSTPSGCLVALLPLTLDIAQLALDLVYRLLVSRVLASVVAKLVSTKATSTAMERT